MKAEWKQAIACRKEFGFRPAFWVKYEAVHRNWLEKHPNRFARKAEYFIWKLTDDPCYHLGNALEEPLKEQYRDILNDALSQPAVPQAENTETLPIWVFWWQGMAQAPEIVRMCYQSILRHAGTHPVILLDQQNYSRHVQIPKHILERLQNGQMTLTHFSDIVRCQLLYHHGGIWMDATMFCTGPIGDELKSFEFYTIHPGGREKTNDHGLWSAFCMMARPGLPLFHYMNEIFSAYWKDHDYLVYYWLVDAFITIAYQENDAARQMIDAVPVNNTEVRSLRPLLNTPFARDTFDQLLINTYLFKLSYRYSFVREIDGQQTVYGRLLEEYGIPDPQKGSCTKL